jgi:hypothetical protein
VARQPAELARQSEAAMSTDLRELLSEVSSFTPSLKDLLTQRETAALAVKTFHIKAEEWLTEKRLAEISLREINAKIKQLYGEVP